jgi:nitroimidazol reductase NimA-like FMN-containing flavoprotein (pyridoxamine 5'-phosphate oxidase superfamily)
MSDPAGPIVVIPEDESWQLLASRTLGRLATSVGGQPEIFPVNFVVQRRSVLFRTAEGTKLASTVANNRVAFEVDDHNLEGGWSVILKGHAQMLQTEEEIADAERAQLLPWIATRKRHYVRIIPTEISGRRFQFGTEPDEDFSYAT